MQAGQWLTSSLSSNTLHARPGYRDRRTDVLPARTFSWNTTYKERLKLPTPDWALSHKAGHLSELNLDGKQPEKAGPIPGYADQPWSNKEKKSIGTYFWIILAQVPGGRMTLEALKGTFEEWMCQGYKKGCKEQSYRSALTLGVCFHNESLTGRSGIWRIATKAEEAWAIEKKSKQDKSREEAKVKAELEARHNSEARPEEKKRQLSDPTTKTSSEPPAKKHRTQNSARTKLPSSPSPKIQTPAAPNVKLTPHSSANREQATQSPARTKLPSSPSPNREVLTQNPPRTNHSDRSSSTWTTVNSKRSPDPPAQRDVERPPGHDQQKQNKTAVDPANDPSPLWNQGLDLNYQAPLIREDPAPEPQETLQVSDDVAGDSSGSSSGCFFDDHNRPELTLHLKQRRNDNVGLQDGPCEMASGRCSCLICVYKRSFE